MISNYLFTSESVTEGHPDKVCDQISDAILDAVLAHDPNGRVASEVVCSTGQINVLGEISTCAYVDYSKIVRDVVKDIGYNDPLESFNADTCSVNISIDKQSPDKSFQ